MIFRFEKYLTVVPALFLILGNLSLYSAEIDDRLLLIREGYRDGLDTLVRDEADSFMAASPHHPAVPEVALILGMIEKKAGRYRKAERVLNIASQSTDPELEAKATYELARLYHQQKKYDLAAQWFDRTLEINAGDAYTDPATYWRAISYYMSNNYHAAIQALSINLSSYTTFQNLERLYFRGLSYLAVDQYERAVLDLDLVYKHAPEDYRFESALAASRFCLDKKQFDDADLWLYKTLKIRETGTVLLMRSRLKFSQDLWADAAGCYRAAASMQDMTDLDVKLACYRAALCEARSQKTHIPNWWQPLVDFIFLYPDTNFVSKILNEIDTNAQFPIPATAIDVLLDGIEVDVNTDGRLLAGLYLQAGRADKAMYWLTRSMIKSKTFDPDPMDRITAANILQALNEPGAALNELNGLLETIESEKNNDHSLLEANLLFQSGEFESAAAIYQQWLTENSDSNIRTKILFWMGECYFRLEKWHLAAGTFSAYQEINSEVNEYLESAERRLLISYFHLNNWQGVIESCDRYLAQFTDSDHIGEVLFRQGLAYANTGLYDQAMSKLGTALDRITDPEYLESIKDAMRQIDAARKNLENPDLSPHDKLNSVASSEDSLMVKENSQ